MRKNLIFLKIFILGIILGACHPVPFEDHKLSAEEKTAEIYTMLARFKSTYAPLGFKEATLNFKIEQLTAELIDEAIKADTNSEYYAIIKKFFAKFADAHTSVSFVAQTLSGGSKVAYLGFSTQRVGEVLAVTSLLPTMIPRKSKTGESSKNNFPIKPGMIISGVFINGEYIKIRDYLKSELNESINLGQEESNFTARAGRAFFRDALSTGLPKGWDKTPLLNIEVVYADGSEVSDFKTIDPVTKLPIGTKKVKLPWNIQDIAEFKLDIASSRAVEEGKVTGISVTDQFPKHDAYRISFADYRGRIIEIDPTKIFDPASEIPRQLVGDKAFKMLSQFRLNLPPTQFVFSEAADNKNPFNKKTLSAFERLKQERVLPEAHTPVPTATTYPAYVEFVPQQNGTFKSRGYIRIDTFSPETDKSEDEILEEIKDTLRFFAAHHVKNIVIDQIDNGGGSLSLGVKMAQLFSPKKKIANLKIQFGLNQSWLADLFRGSTIGNTKLNKTIQGALYGELLAQFKEGKKISKSYPIESILPYEVEPDVTLPKFNTVLLVNEMCASMGDMFPILMKENGLATIMGTRTMGAGGNVVGYEEMQFSHFKYNVTESLIVTPLTNKYVENNGVTPHVYLDTTVDTFTKFAYTIAEGYQYLENPKSYAKERAAAEKINLELERLAVNEKPEGYQRCENALTLVQASGSPNSGGDTAVVKSIPAQPLAANAGQKPQLPGDFAYREGTK